MILNMSRGNKKRLSHRELRSKYLRIRFLEEMIPSKIYVLQFRLNNEIT